MEFSYQLLFNVAFKHRYHADHNCNAFITVLPIETKLLMKRYGLTFKAFSTGFQVYYETRFAGKERSLAEMKKQSFVLCFYLINTDPYFLNYTSNLVDFVVSNQLLCFKNEADSTDNSRLHKKEYVTSADIQAVTDESIPGSLTKPFARIDIALPHLQTEKYFIQFEPRLAYWRYTIATPYLLELETPAIIHRNSKMLFTGPVSLQLPDNRQALLFTSEQPLYISERSEQNLQLVENFNAETGRYKVVINRLPNPDIRHLSVIDPRADRKERMKYVEVII